MQVEPCKQFLLDAGTDSVTEERAVRYDDRRPARFRSRPQLPHDELQEQERRLGRLFVFRKVRQDAAFFFSAERRIGKDYVHPLRIGHLGEPLFEAVAAHNLRSFQAVQ